MQEKVILITGITGFIGQHLATYLTRHYPSCRLVGVSRHHAPHTVACDFYAVDLLHIDPIQEVIAKTKPDYIFHLAGTVFSYDWDVLYQGNVTATQRLLAAVKKTQLSTHTIIAGSVAEYGVVPLAHLPVSEVEMPLPQSPYGMTKWWQTCMAQYYARHELLVSVGRIFNVIGAGTAPQLSTGDIFRQITHIRQGKQTPHIHVGNLQIKRDFIDIDDVCRALIAIATTKQSGSLYNICAGYSVTLQNILDWSIQAANMTVDIIFDQTKSQNAYVPDIYGSHAKLKQDTGWQPSVLLADSVKKALNL